MLDQGHEYKEFRWAEVLDLPEPLAPGDAGAWVVRYPLARRAAFSSSELRLDAAWALGAASIFNTALDARAGAPPPGARQGGRAFPRRASNIYLPPARVGEILHR